MTGGAYEPDWSRSMRTGRCAWAVVAVNGAGDEAFWIIDYHGEPSGCVDCYPDHERTGRLPAWIRERIHGRVLCGADTATGDSCRNVVQADGDRCHHHVGRIAVGRTENALSDSGDSP